jgi:predicted metal-dependent hydrolase
MNVYTLKKMLIILGKLLEFKSSLKFIFTEKLKPLISNVKKISITGIGDVKITRSKRNKKLCISINKNRIVKVSIPLRVNFGEGERFLFEKMEWIKQTIHKIEQISHSAEIIDENIEFATRSRKLKFIPGLQPDFKMILKNDEIQIQYPEGINIKSEISQTTIKKLILGALRKEAKEYIPNRVAEIAKTYNFHYNLVKIRNSRSRWGSCSYNNNINLSLHLVRLPDTLSDYVILHELIHTIHKNHSSKFWELFTKLVGNAKQKSQLLRKFKLDLLI